MSLKASHGIFVRDGDNDFVDSVPQSASCVQDTSKASHITPIRVDDDDCVDPVPQFGSGFEDTSNTAHSFTERHFQEKGTCVDKSFMKAIRSLKLYGYEDIEPAFYDVTVNDYTVEDIKFSLAYSHIYLVSYSKNKRVCNHFGVICHKEGFHKHASKYITTKCYNTTCMFYVRAKQIEESSTYQVRKDSLNHVCVISPFLYFPRF